MTQWPRFEVFQQERDGRPHQNAGSVHAPDMEMAMQMARDVFVRRPQCFSLWVVPAGKVFAKTAQELEDDNAWRTEALDPAAASEIYTVFTKQSQRRAMVYVAHVGEVEARSPADALALALEKFDGRNVFVWWVVPARAIGRSDPDEVESMFAPAFDKSFRSSREYHVLTQMQEIKH